MAQAICRTKLINNHVTESQAQRNDFFLFLTSGGDGKVQDPGTLMFLMGDMVGYQP